MAEPLNLDLRGLLGVRAQLALATLPPQLRRRLLNNALKRVRAQARRNVSGQASPDGAPFPPRKRKGRRKMLSGLVKPKHLNVTQLNTDQGVLGWRNGLMGHIAGQHQDGYTERRTAAQMRRWNRVQPNQACTEKQAKRLRRLGFRVRQAGKRGLSRPSVPWIQEHVGFLQAGVLIRVLRDEQPGPQSWEITLPKRTFLGITQEETGRLVAQFLEQILNSPR
ncbi:virion morphogenesis protein [Pseudomonas aeruginosa]|uniref:virion morphogenesis protein n=1 Tax=Pseudomonas aeruginosa TaxID=287 RepID=UPI001F064810|nr:virion morphogenesis protein [Pseudomonas aeruginosa]MCH0742722.1 virion morphogenesis protein [Pseudomonas aeruginosa]